MSFDFGVVSFEFYIQVLAVETIYFNEIGITIHFHKSFD